MFKKVNIMTGADVSTINEAISARIKQYRKQQKISLDELSRRANISKGMLVEIEGLHVLLIRRIFLSCGRDQREDGQDYWRDRPARIGLSSGNG